MQTLEQLESGLDHILQAPKDSGVLELIVRRPAINEREVLSVAQLDLEQGLVGDNWAVRGSKRMPDKTQAHPEMQLNLMNSRVLGLLSPDPQRWSLAGDQLIVDLDLSLTNLPPGTRLAVDSAIIEVTAQPHTGCKKFSERFGVDALRFVNAPAWRDLHLRGINAKVVQPGAITSGATIEKLRTASCSCGQLRVTCQGAPIRVGMCHCLACQQRTGSAFGVQARFPRDKVKVEGDSKLYERVGDTNTPVHFTFCPHCGSTVCWQFPSTPETIAVAVGAFADPNFPAPHISVYNVRRHPWALTAEGTITEHWD